MNTLEFIQNKFKLEFGDKTPMPVVIPNSSRRQLASLFAELNFDKGAEIGVREGYYSEILCQANPKLKLFGIDPYQSYKGYRDQIDESYDDYLEQAKKLLSTYNNYEFVRKFSQDALNDFEDQSLDFVYIDGNHDFKNCTDDIVGWSKKVKFGGIISGHDYAKYRRPTNIHCYEVVNGYTAAYNIRPWFVTSGKYIEDGEEKVEAASWFWVNQPLPGVKGNRE